MSGSGFTVNLDQLQGAVDELDAYDRRLQEQLRHLESVIAALNARWQGASAEAHAEAHRQWAAGAAELGAASRRMRAIVATARANHSGAQEANVQMWEQFV